MGAQGSVTLVPVTALLRPHLPINYGDTTHGTLPAPCGARCGHHAGVQGQQFVRQQAPGAECPVLSSILRSGRKGAGRWG